MKPPGDVDAESGPLFPAKPAVLTTGVPRVGTHKRSWVMTRREIGRAVVAERAAGVVVPLARRPRTRADCIDGSRPCPWVGCRYHLGLEATAAGGLQFTRPGADLEDLPETCALDVADQGAMTLAKVGGLLNLTRARVLQIEGEALARLRQRATELA